MIRYALLYKDETTKISYFYTLDNNMVYTDRKPINTNKITKWSWSGSVVGILIYSLISLTPIWSINPQKSTSIIIALVGLLLGWIISLLIIKHTEKYFIEENKQEMKSEQIKKMYIDGKEFRRKYRLLLTALFAFSVISTAVISKIFTNMFILIMLIPLWIIVGMMYFLNRPICSRKIKNIMEQI